jgi:hypothetical protein
MEIPARYISAGSQEHKYMTTLNAFGELDAVEFEISEEAVADWHAAEPVVQQVWSAPLPNSGGTLTQTVSNDDGAF